MGRRRRTQVSLPPDRIGKATGSSGRARARILLTSGDEGTTEYIGSDLRDTGKVLARASQSLDFGKPTAVTLLAILHAVPDADDRYAIVAALMDAIPAGSYLAVSHGAWDLIDQEAPQGDGAMGPGRGRDGVAERKNGSGFDEFVGRHVDFG